MPANGTALARGSSTQCNVLETLGARRRAIELLVQKPGKFADVVKILFKEFSLEHSTADIRVAVI